VPTKPREFFKFAVFRNRFEATTAADGKSPPDGWNGEPVSPGVPEFVNPFVATTDSDGRSFTETGAIVCGNFPKFDAAKTADDNKAADGLNGELCDRLTVGDGVLLRDDVGDGVLLRDDVGDGVLLRVGDGVLLRDGDG
jgi:hypothetical protein